MIQDPQSLIPEETHILSSMVGDGKGCDITMESNPLYSLTGVMLTKSRNHLGPMNSDVKHGLAVSKEMPSR